MVKGYEVEFIDDVPDEILQVQLTCHHGRGSASWVLRIEPTMALRICEAIINGLAEREYRPPRHLTSVDRIKQARGGEPVAIIDGDEEP